MRLPHALGDFHISEDSCERRVFWRTGIDAETDVVGTSIHVADTHLGESDAIGRALDAVVVGPA